MGYYRVWLPEQVLKLWANGFIIEASSSEDAVQKAREILSHVPIIAEECIYPNSNVVKKLKVTGANEGS